MRYVSFVQSSFTPNPEDIRKSYFSFNFVKWTIRCSSSESAAIAIQNEEDPHMRNERFTGEFLVQARSFPQIVKIAKLPWARPQRLPTESELHEFLAFLSLRALATGFRYDATIPDQFVEELSGAARTLELEHSIRPLDEEKDAFYADVERAAANAALSIFEQLENPPKAYRSIDPDSVDGFFDTATRVLGEKDDTNRNALATDAYNRGLMGGKLLVGLAADRNVAALRKIVGCQTRQPSLGADIMSLAINRFRAVLLSTWAGQNGALLAAEPEVLSVLGKHNVLLWQEIELQLAKMALSVSHPEQATHPDVFPMVGLAVLVEAEGQLRPLDLVTKADQIAEGLNLKVLQKAVLNAQAQAESGNTMSNIVDDLWRRVRKRNGPRHEEYEPLWKRAKHELAPSTVLGVLAGAAAAIGAPALVSILAAGAAASIGDLVLAIWRGSRSKDPLAAAISNVLAISRDEAETVHKQVESIWRPA